MRNRAVGLAAFSAAALGGAALGFLGERRVMPDHGADASAASPVVPEDPGAHHVDIQSHDRTLLHAEVGGATNAPTLLFAHGVGLSSATWLWQRHALADRFRTVAFDHRGHGRSARAAGGDYALEAMGDDVVAVLDATAPSGPVVLVGHSMGGMAILSCVIRYPELVGHRVQGIVLCNTAASGLLSGAVGSGIAAALGMVQARLQGAVLGRSRRARRRLESSDPADRPSTDLSLLVTQQFGLSADAAPALVGFLEQQLRATAPVVLGACATSLSQVNLQAAAADLALPALVLVGARDRLTPPRQARRLVDALSGGEAGAQLVEVEGAGHTVMLEQPEVVTTAIADFAARTLAQAEATG